MLQCVRNCLMLLLRLTTCLEMLGNLTVVREMSGILLKIREKILSGKSCINLFIVSWIFASIQVCTIWFWIMHCCIPTFTTDSNTSTGMIWVTLNMPSATEECCEPSGHFTLSGEWSPWLLLHLSWKQLHVSKQNQISCAFLLCGYNIQCI